MVLLRAIVVSSFSSALLTAIFSIVIVPLTNRIRKLALALPLPTKELSANIFAACCSCSCGTFLIVSIPFDDAAILIPSSKQIP